MLHRSQDELDDLSSLGAAAPLAAFSCKKGSQPLMVILEHIALLDSDREDTDTEDLYTADQVAYVPKLGSGQAVLRDCPVCKIHLESGMALFRHLHSTHLEDRPY